MVQNNEIDFLSKVKAYIAQLFKKQDSNKLVYYTFDYLLNLQQLGDELCTHYEINAVDREVLLIVLFFQYTGYLVDYELYENESLKIAQAFLEEANYPKERLNKVLGLIKRTSSNESPTSLLEEILHDVNIVYLSKKGFCKKQLLRKVEIESNTNNRYINEVWEQKVLQLFLENDFLTSYAHEKYGKRRLKNIDKQYNRLQESKRQRKKKKAGKSFGRGIETLYRATYRNHINLSSIADAKANMMISINTIIMSVIITFAGAGFTVSSEIIVQRLRYTIPILILLLASLLSVVFAVLSARPKVTERNITEQKLKERKSSILFFGNFTQMPMNRFIEFLDGFKHNQKLLYDNMSIDIYFLGLVLNQKYRLLRISYNIFMIGLILSVLTFIGILLFTSM